MDRKKDMEIMMPRVRLLLDRYFNASISQEELAELSLIAKLAAGNAMPGCNQEIINDLRLINSINEFSISYIGLSAASAPAGLEQRLTAHISDLASHKPRRAPRRIIRFASAVTAAAVIGLVAWSGAHFLLPDSDCNAPAYHAHHQSDTPATVTAAYSPGESSPAQNLMAVADVGQEETLTATPAANRKSQRGKAKRQSKTVDHDNNIPDAAQIDTEKVTEEVMNALSIIPPFANDAYATGKEAFQVMPSGITARVETSRILMQPITTLSQSICNVYDSMETVAVALSGISSALETASSSISLLSNPTHPI